MHTQVPWRAQGPKISEVADGQTYFTIGVHASYQCVGFYYPHSKQTAEEMQANADFICKAANEHDKIIAALKKARTYLYDCKLKIDMFNTGNREVSKITLSKDAELMEIDRAIKSATE